MIFSYGRVGVFTTLRLRLDRATHPSYRLGPNESAYLFGNPSWPIGLVCGKTIDEKGNDFSLEYIHVFKRNRGHGKTIILDLQKRLGFKSLSYWPVTESGERFMLAIRDDLMALGVRLRNVSEG